MATVISAIAICLQWREMHTGSVDQHALADAAKSSVMAASLNADASRNFANTAKAIDAGVQGAVQQLSRQAQTGQRIADENLRQAVSERLSAQAAIALATSNVQSLELSQRPWLAVTTKVASPLTADTREIHLTVHYEIQNVGHNPAVSVDISPELYIESSKKLRAPLERNRLCHVPLARGINYGGQLDSEAQTGAVIYPGQIRTISYALSLTKNEFDQYAAQFAVNIPYVRIHFVDCVRYKASFSDTTYYIGNTYALQNTDPHLGQIPRDLVGSLPVSFEPDVFATAIVH